MEWGFGLAIAGVVIILIATIWYFASYLNQLHTIVGKGSQPIVSPSGVPVTHSQPGCTPATVPATGDNISLKEGLAATGFPTISAIGWGLGVILVIGGTIWGLVSRSKEKPDSKTAQVLNALLAQKAAAPQAAPVAAAPAARVSTTTSALSSLTADDIAKLKTLLST